MIQDMFDVDKLRWTIFLDSFNIMVWELWKYSFLNRNEISKPKSR